MRPLLLLPLLLAGCVQPPSYDSAWAVQQAIRSVPTRTAWSRRAGSNNCGTPYQFKLCRIIVRPSHRPPIYAEQLEDILASIPISDMPAVIAKDTKSQPMPGPDSADRVAAVAHSPTTQMLP